MYRKFEITDASDSKIEIEVHPGNLVKVERHDIDITLATRSLLTQLITTASRFMTGNTIMKVKIEEIEEE